MVRMVDTSLWVDYFRSQTPDAVRVRLHHQIPVVTFDDHFQHIAGVAPLKLEFLKRAVA